ncbi:MAG: hypothetical protein JW821_10870 [Deltaproteobacteria bacterium]|nr:hypothetical protein [Deltaproteobacteria bacterium]
MTDGLNRQFMRNPPDFLGRIWAIDVPNAAFIQVDADGIGTFDLVINPRASLGTRSVILRPFRRNWHNWRLLAHPIRAYYLPSVPNRSPTLRLGTRADYFFTDTIQGCMFAAYGDDRNHLTVMHANALNIGGQEELTRQAGEIRAGDHAYTMILDPATYRTAPDEHPGDWQAEMVTVTVVGWRRNDGWHFYHRRRHDPYGGAREVFDVDEL